MAMLSRALVSKAWSKLDVLERLTAHNGDDSYVGLKEAIAKGGDWEAFCRSNDMPLGLRQLDL